MFLSAPWQNVLKCSKLADLQCGSQALIATSLNELQTTEIDQPSATHSSSLEVNT